MSSTDGADLTSPTSPTDLTEIRAADGPSEAIVATPGEPGPHPGVLVFMDAIGLRPRLQEMCARIASWGYVVMAPNVFYREGRAADLAPTEDLRAEGARERFFAAAMPRVGRLSADQAERDIPAYLEALRGREDVADSPVGVVGYCMGVRLAMRAGGIDTGVAAVAGFHGGGLVTEDPDSPHRRLATTRAELCFGHADNDRSNPPEAVAELGRTLEEHGLRAVNEVYDGAPHGYSMSDTPMYDEQATERSFAAMQELFGRTLRP